MGLFRAAVGKGTPALKYEHPWTSHAERHLMLRTVLNISGLTCIILLTASTGAGFRMPAAELCARKRCKGMPYLHARTSLQLLHDAKAAWSCATAFKALFAAPWHTGFVHMQELGQDTPSNLSCKIRVRTATHNATRVTASYLQMQLHMHEE